MSWLTDRRARRDEIDKAVTNRTEWLVHENDALNREVYRARQWISDLGEKLRAQEEELKQAAKQLRACEDELRRADAAIAVLCAGSREARARLQPDRTKTAIMPRIDDDMTATSDQPNVRLLLVDETVTLPLVDKAAREREWDAFFAADPTQGWDS